MRVKLNKIFVRNGKVDEYDTRQMKVALNHLGYYTPYKKTGITDIPDAQVFEALKAFQKDQGLSATGEIRPDDDTVKALNSATENNKKNQYIWRTMGDSSVRSSHAALEGQVRDFYESPAPGEEPNCRCWGEPVKENLCEDKEIAWVNASAKLFIAEQNLQRTEKEKAKLEEQKADIEFLLSQINAEIAKEKKDKRRAKNKGGAIGATTGAILGSPAGVGSSALLAGIGLGVGSNIGYISEEIRDALNENERTDISLGFAKQKLLKQIKELEEKIKEITNHINKTLLPELRKAQQEEREAREALMECRRRNKNKEKAH